MSDEDNFDSRHDFTRFELPILEEKVTAMRRLGIIQYEGIVLGPEPLALPEKTEEEDEFVPAPPPKKIRDLKKPEDV